ncbi:MAG: DUF1638 domain-containing protein [Desulfobacterales bacterium]|jgi:hypothetical protein|nr:DUF1638 domain-containing protein [Desulfobacteraceae bacterium]MBT4363120.1 DUF1638 domain-containing protein [Desulfobacteraceae bacterium]MBT7086196.1 DUF1638 domain-containing protein [Desulfobacterales bacterium]MBT7695799.1 DUF1638 domain-containing protein [Desulfobacterales bacterium]
MNNISFADVAIVACGTLSMELNQLKEEGFLDTEHLYFTTPGLHQDIHELERQLIDKIKKAKEKVDKVIVVYGGKYCYVNVDDPLRTMQTIIEEQGEGIARVEATHCMNMIADEEEQKKIGEELAGGEKVWWMTPGWVKFRKLVFKGWDKGVANENFPRHTGGAIVLDGIGYLDRYMEENPEEFLDYCDWMGIPMQTGSVSLDRLKSLLFEQAQKLDTAK